MMKTFCSFIDSKVPRAYNGTQVDHFHNRSAMNTLPRTYILIVDILIVDIIEIIKSGSVSSK